MYRILLSILLTTTLFAREYIAIIDFEGLGVSQQEARSLSQRLTSEMIKLEVYQVLERSEMKRLLDEQKLQSSGCVSTQCAVDIGKMLGAKYMVVGSVNKVGRTFSIDARMIDVETSESYTSALYDYTGEIDLLLKKGMTSVAHQLCDIPYSPKEINNNSYVDLSLNNKTMTQYSKSTYSQSNRSFETLFFVPAITTIKRNNNGQIIGTKGYHLALGFYRKNYYRPVEINSWNPYWLWGTWSIFVPMIGWGTEYIKDDEFFFGIGAWYGIYPHITIGKYY